MARCIILNEYERDRDRRAAGTQAGEQKYFLVRCCSFCSIDFFLLLIALI